MAPSRTPLVRIDAAAALAARARTARSGPLSATPNGESPRRITLQRASGGPLIFHGLDLWTASTRDETGPVWHVLRLFDLPDGRYVLAIERYSDPGETLEESYAEILANAEAVLTAAAAYDPLTGVPQDSLRRNVYSHAAERFRDFLRRQFGVDRSTTVDQSRDTASVSHCHREY